MVVTAYGDDERKRRARELGAFEFITKPVDLDQLKEQLPSCPPLWIETGDDFVGEAFGTETAAVDFIVLNGRSLAITLLR
jgi:CheY-like chemotaxis protein